MISYSQRTIFTARELELLREATSLVESMPEVPEGWPEIRCHELARAVGDILGLEVEEGRFGMAEHSWLWTEPIVLGRGRWPNILDVYAVGSLPMVQLVDTGHFLPHNTSYKSSHVKRTDIQQEMVDWLKYGPFQG